MGASAIRISVCSLMTTAEDYRLLIEGVQKALGGTHSARIVMSSLWTSRSTPTSWRARIARTGMEPISIATNTLHMFAHDIEKASGLPVLHIVDAVAMRIYDGGYTRMGSASMPSSSTNSVGDDSGSN